jgi:hypothetical protein
MTIDGYKDYLNWYVDGGKKSGKNSRAGKASATAAVSGKRSSTRK